MMEFKERATKRTGFTLVELAIAMLCASLFFCGLIAIYAEGVESFKNAGSRMRMHNEGTIALRQIEAYIRMSRAIDIQESDNPDRTRLTLTLPDKVGDGSSGGDIEFYTNIRDRTVRMDDHRVGENDNNVLVLPKTRFSDHQDRRFPYRIRSIFFQYGDEDLDEYNHWQSMYLVKIDMVLEDWDGNTVNLSSTQSRLN